MIETIKPKAIKKDNHETEIDEKEFRETEADEGKV